MPYLASADFLKTTRSCLRSIKTSLRLSRSAARGARDGAGHFDDATMKKEFKVKERGLYKAGSDTPFKVSRSGIELFRECSCCFYLNNRAGIRRPSDPAIQYQ